MKEMDCVEIITEKEEYVKSFSEKENQQAFNVPAESHI